MVGHPCAAPHGLRRSRRPPPPRSTGEHRDLAPIRKGIGPHKEATAFQTVDIISLSLYIGAAGTIAAIIVSVLLFSVNWQLARLQHPRVIMRLSEPEARRTDQSPNG